MEAFNATHDVHGAADGQRWLFFGRRLNARQKVAQQRYRKSPDSQSGVRCRGLQRTRLRIVTEYWEVSCSGCSQRSCTAVPLRRPFAAEASGDRAYPVFDRGGDRPAVPFAGAGTDNAPTRGFRGTLGIRSVLRPFAGTQIEQKQLGPGAATELNFALVSQPRTAACLESLAVHLDRSPSDVQVSVPAFGQYDAWFLVAVEKPRVHARVLVHGQDSVDTIRRNDQPQTPALFCIGNTLGSIRPFR